VALNDPEGEEAGVAKSSNADVLRRTIDVPILVGLDEKQQHLPPEWGQIATAL
jgi:hypothetical protein